MNYIDAKNRIVKQIIGFMGDRNAIIGESGGIDSALVTFLCVEALGVDRVFAITMPYGKQSTADADLVAQTLALGVKNYKCINIKPMVDSFGFDDRMTVGNTKARVRMINLYAAAAENNGIVVGTSNKTEMMLGYFTKFGDGGCDIEPIGDLYKTDVWGMAKAYPAFPQSIITKSPSAELWEGQTDEKEIGMTYAEMDAILKVMEETKQYNLENPNVKRIFDMYIKTEHKRRMPPTFFVT